MEKYKQEYLDSLKNIGIALSELFNDLWGETGFVLLLVDPKNSSNVNQLSNLSMKGVTEALEAALASNDKSSTAYFVASSEPNEN